MTNFYRRFVPNFSTIATPLSELVKKGVDIKWVMIKQRSFANLKDKLINAPLLALPNFFKTFEVKCDASNVGIRVVFLQERHHIAYFNEKLKGSHINYFSDK